MSEQSNILGGKNMIPFNPDSTRLAVGEMYKFSIAKKERDGNPHLSEDGKDFLVLCISGDKIPELISNLKAKQDMKNIEMKYCGLTDDEIEHMASALNDEKVNVKTMDFESSMGEKEEDVIIDMIQKEDMKRKEQENENKD